MDSEGVRFILKIIVLYSALTGKRDKNAHQKWSSRVFYWMYIKTEPAVSGSGRERLKAALYGRQILFPGGQCVEELLPLLFAEGAVCAVATGSE